MWPWFHDFPLFAEISFMTIIISKINAIQENTETTGDMK